MKYMILGCGDIGRTALERLGADSVLYFADNYHSGETICGKQILAFSEMAELCAQLEDVVIVIASEGYWEELEAQVLAAGLTRYAVFRWYSWPVRQKNQGRVYLSWEELVKNFHLTSYRRIGIYGENLFAFFLARELQRRTSDIQLISIPQTSLERYRVPLPLPQRSLDEVDGRIDCLCLAVPRCEDGMALRERFLTGRPSYAVVDLYDTDCFDPEFHYPGIEEYKNIHSGERMFLIGNGPSLRLEDLNKLHEHRELCMAFNKVYRAYDRTPWRADYLGFTDPNGIRDCAGEIPNLPGKIFMADTFHTSDNPHFWNVNYFHLIKEPFCPCDPGFSFDLSRGAYHGNSVVYDIGLQLAAYMGAPEIYLLGVDHTLSGDLTKPEKHFIQDYNYPGELEQYRGISFNTDKATIAYQKAEQYSRAHGFRIFNATRGGRLEAFERVEFDALF